MPERVTLVALQPGAPIIRTFLDDDLLADLDRGGPSAAIAEWTSPSAWRAHR